MLNFFRFKGEHREFYLFFKNTLGFTPRNTKLYQIAFIHKSKSLDMGQGRKVNNERLEYLGDAVLSAIVAEFLYKKYPNQGEGFLTEMRSKIVSRANLNKLAQKIGLSQLVQYNRVSQDIFKSIDGDTFEALIGAIYLEKGYNFTLHIVIDKIINLHLDVDTMAHTDWNFKSKIIDWGQKNHKKISFEVERVFYQGKESRRHYDVRVKVDDTPAEHAIEYSIKAAEQLAAEKTYKKYQEQGIIPTHTEEPAALGTH
jgi:ribonuclease-3